MPGIESIFMVLGNIPKFPARKNGQVQFARLKSFQGVPDEV
jgi:hypothetical protein